MDNKELRNSLIDFDMITSRVLGATDSEQLIFSQQRVDAYMKGLDELHEVAKDREVVGNIDTWEQ